MSWTIQTNIGEMRPWPDVVDVVRGSTDEMLRYVPERTCRQVITDCDDGLLPPFTAHCSECGDEWGHTPKYCPNCGARVVWGGE